MSGEAQAAFLAGVPVAVDPVLIEKELSALWKPGGSDESSVTRACLSNLVFDLPDEASRGWLGPLLDELGRRFPSRTLLIDRAAKASRGEPLRAWISAICHVKRPGAPPVCCEQVRLELDPERLDLLVGAVAPLLVPDVPVILICAGRLRREVVERLQPLPDRIVVDSRRAGFDALEDLERATSEPALVDVDELAWRATGGWRALLAEIFDDRLARPLLENAARVEIGYRGSPLTPALFAGWLSARLEWRLSHVRRRGDGLVARLEVEDRRIALELHPTAGEAATASGITSLVLSGADATVERLEVAWSEEERLAHLQYRTREACVLPRSVPFPFRSDVELLGEILDRPTDSRAFREALAVAVALGNVD